MGKTTRLLILLTAAITLFLSDGVAAAKMYVCVDAAGKEQFSNMNTSGDCKVLGGSTKDIDRPGEGEYTYRPTTHYRSMRRDPSTYDHYIRRASRRYDVDPFLIKAVIKTESNFDRFAISKKGAQGLMQLMPETAEDLRVRDPFNPHENIDGGTRYLRDMLILFKGNVPLSLAAYNAGPTKVRRLQKIPRIPETIRYVQKVLGHYKGYRGSLPKEPVQLAASSEG